MANYDPEAERLAIEFERIRRDAEHHNDLQDKEFKERMKAISVVYMHNNKDAYTMWKNLRATDKRIIITLNTKSQKVEWFRT